MSNVVALEGLLDSRRVWKGHGVQVRIGTQPTGYAELDERLPFGGWPEAALTEILLPYTGIGDIKLLWPTLARLTQSGERVTLIAPPYLPYPQAWIAAGVDMGLVSIVEAKGRETLWAAEQCLRSGSCGAVLCWPERADGKALRRLQVAAETGQTLAFVYRSLEEAANPSPAALRLVIEPSPLQLRILKCRGGQPKVLPLPAAAWR